MKRLTRIIAAAAFTLPLAVFAQTSTGVQPADAPRNAIEKDATQNNGQATKYGSQTDSANGQADTGSSSMSKSKHSMMKRDKSTTGSSATDGQMTNKEKGSMSNGGDTSPAPVTPTGKDGGMHK